LSFGDLLLVVLSLLPVFGGTSLNFSLIVVFMLQFGFEF
jgi:hypothetical protein